MSTAPPGWHRQPDGRERYWDGTAWTDEFRDPAAAPTQQIPIDETQQMPSSGWESDSAWGADSAPAPQEYASRTSSYPPPPPHQPHREQYPREPYVGAPDGPGGPLSDRSGSTPGWMKGCLGFLLALLLVALVAVGIGLWWVSREADSPGSATPTDAATTEQTPAEEPTTQEPSGEPDAESTDGPSLSLPTGIPTAFPTDLPTLPGIGESVEVAPGEAFTLGPAQIQSGWKAEDLGFGFTSVTMAAVPQEQSQVPLLFRLTFVQGGTDLASTMCTVDLSQAGSASEVSCIPFRADVDSADAVRAAGMGG